MQTDIEREKKYINLKKGAELSSQDVSFRTFTVHPVQSFHLPPGVVHVPNDVR